MSDFTESEGDNPDAIEQGGDDGPLGEDRNAVIEEPAEFYIDNLRSGHLQHETLCVPEDQTIGPGHVAPDGHNGHGRWICRAVVCISTA